MITFVRGNLLDAPAEALVNTVNETGVMGKGIALMFREAYPGASAAYQDAAKSGKIHVGRMFVSPTGALFGPRWVIHFPTKRHWRHSSKLEWIREGLRDLSHVLREHDIHSVALPPLGCGNGGLEWDQVRREIEAALGNLTDVDTIVFEPSDAYYNAPKRAGIETLTPARALVAELIRRYSILGIECSHLEVQKLAWFLQRAIVRLGLPDALDLRFAANKFGPYADRLRHLLDALDGSYLHSERRLADARPHEPLWVDDVRRAVLIEYIGAKLDSAYLVALENTSALVDGFESPLGMELLATLDWLLLERRCAPTVDAIRAELGRWPGEEAASKRKLKLFDSRLVGLGLRRLTVERPMQYA